MLILFFSICFSISVYAIVKYIGDYINKKASDRSEKKGHLPRLSIKEQYAKLPPKRQRLVIAMIIFLALLIVLGNMIFALIGSCLYIYADWNIKSKKAKKTADLIDLQVIESLSIIKSAVLAGQSLQNAMSVAAEELKEPIKSEFVQISDELALGVDFDAVLSAVSSRAKSKEFKFMIDTIMLSKDSGASLSGIFDKIIKSATQRISIKNKTIALTSQGKLSGTVVSCIPFLIILIMYAMQPDMIGVLFTTIAGNFLLLLVMIMILIGSFVIRKLTEIDL
ncbi:MAG: type II secretion system F family protein [Elusimicrobiota bacterium]|jgi:tight adherence protein B|nr:type II secretion system F family protein [Elusimicrobiota bacterium]